ncbi:MAG: 5,6-dimethylbenzimidazole synthase, partial [Bosea sp. (in: a-proteobacteria)]
MNLDASSSAASASFQDEGFRETFTQLLAWRRDVRHFRRDPVPDALVTQLIDLACLSPSVGNAQPWRFVLVETPERRAAVIANFEASNAAALAACEPEKQESYAALKLAGLREAPIHLAVFCDEDPSAGHGLGRQTMPEMLRYSVVCAV